MPTYCYTCDSCNHNFEVNSTISERNAPLDEPCPSCGAISVRRSLEDEGGPSFIDPFVLGRRKIDNGFKEVLRNIKTNHPKGNIGTNRLDGDV